ncbi:AraC family transcriptional regulator [Niallia circulans]|uniref:AraC family transcriptional regulator n=1 Tax=Niallia circulans TaxID=1397 RepID=UPI0002DA0E57|nr:AraC family transcriptional regulator [Niallia circulans]AYV69595.1 AraC family transcriptional regulator [Niallia circulans]AYV72014.1 AraC family transcriptional regulator [Niallia circulans]
MEYKYEFIKTDDNLPIKIIYHKSNEPSFVPSHWHDSIELSYVLSGKIEQIYIDGSVYCSKQGDIVLINSNSIHAFSLDRGENRRALSLFIPYEFIKAIYNNIDQVSFDCISINETSEQKSLYFNELRENLDAILKAYLNIKHNPLETIKITGLIYDLVYVLLKNFSSNKKIRGEIKTNKYLDRLMKITNYIKNNYNHNLPIGLIAEKFDLSAEYLSRFFIKHMGMTVHHYINAIRLEKAYRDLMNSDHTILQIALEHGFPNEKSFNRVFKAIYNKSPYQYRKEIKGKK